MIGSGRGVAVIWPLTARVRVRADVRQAGPPDAKVAAREEAARINADRHLALTARVDHILGDSPWIDRPALLAGLAAYHKEAMGRVPSLARYPEARPWVDYALSYERELRRLAKLTDAEIAMLRSLDAYLMFRGFRQWGLKRQEPRMERCRAAFLSETDEGPLLVKNAESDLVLWKPEPPLPARAGRQHFWWEHADWVAEAAACGMHMDDEPEEIFPLPVFAMAAQHAEDTPAVVEFLKRYAPFWGAENVLVVDKKLRAVAIEKTSRNHFELFSPDAAGRCYVSGMGCRDQDSPQGRYVRAQRDEYCRLYGLPDDGVDRAFWKMCDQLEAMLADGLAKLPAKPSAQDVLELFATPYPRGLCLDGVKAHPDQVLTCNTVTTYATLFQTRRYVRWQRPDVHRGDGQTWPARPEMCQFG